MRDAFDTISTAILYGGLFGLVVCGVAIFAIGAKTCLDDWLKTFRSRGAKTVSLIAVALATMYGGSKHIIGRVSVDDPYIRDAGSYVTNDYVHVAVAARYEFIPPTTEVLIFSRELEQTNAADWVQLTRIEEGPYKLGEFPLDIPFANATNYNFLIAANYIPAPTVHTNGVWSIKGFIIPAGGKPPSPATYAFPNTKTIKREDQ